MVGVVGREQDGEAVVHEVAEQAEHPRLVAQVEARPPARPAPGAVLPEATARAISTSCCSPPLRVVKGRRSSAPMPTRSMAARAAATSADPGTENGPMCRALPMSTMSRTR